MSNSVQSLLDQLQQSPEAIEFADVMAVIEANYSYTPVRFTNGEGEGMAVNEAGTNEGSCKIFAFAQLNDLNEQQTVHLFGKFYREDVLQHPDATDHANIRNFMRSGWDGIKFDANALVQN